MASSKWCTSTGGSKLKSQGKVQTVDRKNCFTWLVLVSANLRVCVKNKEGWIDFLLPLKTTPAIDSLKQTRTQKTSKDTSESHSKPREEV